MATKTSLLGLTKPAYTDAADIAVLNGNFDLIDKAVGQGARAGNLLDNSYFPSAYVINQRGKTQYTGNVYTIDRWRLSNATLTVGSDGITLTGNESAAAIATQYIKSLKNGVYTFAAKVGGEVKTRIIQVSGTTVTTIDSNNAAYTVGYISATYSSTGAYAFQIRTNATYAISVEWAALYEGAYTADTLPAYVYKGYAAELAECMRYYQKRDYVITVSQAANDTVVSGFDFMIPMRDAPTVTIHDGEGTANAMSIWTNAGMTNGVAVSQIARVTKWGVGYMTIETPPASYGRVLYLYEASADL